MHVVQWPDLSNILINLNQDIASLWSRAAKDGPWSLYSSCHRKLFEQFRFWWNHQDKSCFQVIWNNRSITPSTQKVLWNGGGGLRGLQPLVDGAASSFISSVREIFPCESFFPIIQLSQVWWKNCLHRSCEVCRGVANCGGAVIIAWLSYHLQ